MPIKIRESVVLEVGTLVVTPAHVCSVPQQQRAPGVHPLPSMADKIMVESGSVGVILQRPQVERPHQFLVQFVGGESWWMYHNEIRPYHEKLL